MHFVLEPLEGRRLLSGLAAPHAALPAASPASSLFEHLSTRTAAGAFAEDQDVGAPTLSGFSSYANGTYTVTGSGSDIGGNADQFHFLSNNWNADGSITANVTTLSNPDGNAKAGLMFRNGTGASAAFVGIFVTPTNGLALVTRAADGSVGNQSTIFGFHAPRFLKLTRAGNAVTAFHSADGVTWIQVGSPQTVTLGAATRVGLAVTSHNPAATATANFANVSLLLPSGWNDNDVGTGAGAPGSAIYDPALNTFNVSGSGADIGGTADRFNFANRAMTGDGTIVARMDSLSAADPLARSGVMFRGDLTAGAVFAGVSRTAQNSVVFQWRTAAGASASSATISNVSGAVWLKLVEQSDVFSAFYSSTNGNWIQVGAAQTVVMPSATTLAGLAVTSHDTTNLAVAAVSSASVVQDGFVDLDIGSHPIAGSATYDPASDTYTLVASGASLNRAPDDPVLRATPATPNRPVPGDQLNFASRSLSGDGSVIAYVDLAASTDPWARGGVMIRSSATSGAAYAALFITARNGVVFEYRLSTGGAVQRQTLVPATGLAAAPAGLKLRRFADNFAAYYSADGINWSIVGSVQTIAMPSVTSAGIASAAQNYGALSTANFTGVFVGDESDAPPGVGVFSASDELFLHDLEQRSMLFFYNEANATTGLVPDSSNANGGGASAFSSIAAVGFGLTGLTIGDHRGWLTHNNAYQRALTTVNFLFNTAQQVNGFFYHFLNPATGQRFGNTELSSIDTALLMAGVLNVAQYWSGTPLATTAMNVFNRVNWPFMQRPNGQFYGAWTPESGFQGGYGDFSEAVLLYLLGLGSSSHPTATSSWTSWSRSPVVHYAGYTFVTAQTGALFTVQYPQAWFDLRGLTDPAGSLNYYVNSQTATLAQRQMCIDLSSQFPDYGPNLWGITASDSANGYTVWGGPPATPNINGTVVPTAPGGSLEFTPRRSVDALRYMQQTYGTSVYKKYGLVDAFNPLTNWTSSLVLGIDQGMMLISAENARSNFVWDVFRQSAVAQQAKTRAFGTSGTQIRFSNPDKDEISTVRVGRVIELLQL